VKQNAVSDDVTADEHQQRMTRSDHELDFGMMLEAKLVPVQSHRTALRVFVRDIARVGAAQRHGNTLFIFKICLVLVFKLNAHKLALNFCNCAVFIKGSQKCMS